MLVVNSRFLLRKHHRRQLDLQHVLSSFHADRGKRATGNADIQFAHRSAQGDIKIYVPLRIPEQ